MIQNSKFKIPARGEARRRRQNSQRGFTLIELLVVIAIIGILATIAIVNTGRNADRDVRLEKDRLVAFLRSAQNGALASDFVKPTSGCYISGEYVCHLCGVGVRKATGEQRLQVFFKLAIGADVNCANDGGSADIEKTYAEDNGISRDGDSFYLKNDVAIDESGGSLEDIFFLIPSGKVYSGGSVLAADTNIPITLEKDGSSAEVAVYPKGRIY